MKFRKKPVVIEAFQMTESARSSNIAWPAWLHKAWQKESTEAGALYPVPGPPAEPDPPSGLMIHTLEGEHYVSLDDWIIRGVKGELYPCKPDIFEATYDEVKD